MRSGAVKNWFGSGNRAAALLWLLTVLVAAIGGVAGHRTVTDVYHGAVEHWLSGQDLYGGGFQYPPTFVLLFAPFHALPHAFGEYLWRGLSALLLAIGCWRLLGLQVTTPARRRRLFLWLSLPVLLTAFDAFRNGQANVLFGALTVLGACALAGRSGAAPRLNQAALLLTLACLIKPFGIVTMLLAVLAWPALAWRFAALILLGLALPYLTAPADYVDQQYRLMASHLAAMSHNPEARFADFNDLLRVLHLAVPPGWCLLLRAGAGLAFAWIWAWAWLRARAGAASPSPTPAGASPALTLYALSAAYLMLFNPMTEQNSYVIAAPFMALLAVGAAGRAFALPVRIALMVLLLSLTVLPEALRHAAPDFGLWWHPLAMVVFTAVFSAGVLFPARGRQVAAGGLANAGAQPSPTI